MSDASFKSATGGDPAEYVLDVMKGAVPTEGDALYSAQRQRTRILERTARGVDAQGSPFAPYSTNGPYYWYPNGRVGKSKFSSRQNKAAVSRYIKRIGVIEGHTGREIGGYTKTRNGEGIRFDSYAAFKATLGRLGVDLQGPRAPHMLQALAIGAGIERSVGDETMHLGLHDRANPAEQVVIGIYGEESARASGHINGIPGKLPQRDFLGAAIGVAQSDEQAMVDDITARCVARVRERETLKT